MTARGAELSSLATALEEITGRITALADAYAAAESDELATELYAVERSLATATRRLLRTAGADS